MLFTILGSIFHFHVEGPNVVRSVKLTGIDVVIVFKFEIKFTIGVEYGVTTGIVPVYALETKVSVSVKYSF